MPNTSPKRTPALTDDVIAEVCRDLPKGDGGFSFFGEQQHMQRMPFLHKSHEEHTKHESHTCHVEHVSHMLHEEQTTVSSCSPISTVNEAFLYANTGTSHENCVFRLAKGLWSLAADGIIQENEYVRYLEEWHNSTDAEFGDGPIREKSVATSDDWFSMKIDKIKVKMGDGDMVNMIEEAKHATNPPEAMQFDCEVTRWLIRLCIILSRESKDGVFFLTCRAPMGPMGVTHNVINMKLKTLCRRGILRLVEKGGREKGKKAKGSLYEYLHPPF